MIPETLETYVLQNSQVQLISQKIRPRFPTWVSAVNQILAELALNRWALREEDQFFSVEVWQQKTGDDSKRPWKLDF